MTTTEDPATDSAQPLYSASYEPNQRRTTGREVILESLIEIMFFVALHTGPQRLDSAL